MSNSTQEVDRAATVATTFRLTFWTGFAWHSVYVQAVDPPATEHPSVLLLTETAKLEALA